jgi:TetR/AcrR family transcriptional regulator, transcriptional repressor for nem operon
VEALRTKGEYLRRGLERMRARGVLREDADPARLADFVTATLQGAILMASVQKERSALEATLEETYRHLRSFAAEPPGT